MQHSLELNDTTLVQWNIIRLTIHSRHALYHTNLSSLFKKNAGILEDHDRYEIMVSHQDTNQQPNQIGGVPGTGTAETAETF